MPNKLTTLGLLFATAGLVAALTWGRLLTCPTSGQVSNLPHEAAVDASVREALRFWHVPGASVVVVRDDRVVYLKGHGVKDVDTGAPVTPDTVFPLSSCTKAFTTTALAMLADEGKMTWDDPVRKHVPFFHLSDPAADAEVTLRDLVSHRTGVGSHEFLWYRSPWGREEIIRRVGRVKLKHPFRSAFHYQTTMFQTAGHAVELTSGRKWEDFVQQRILDPLHMTGADFTTAAALKTADHATPHRKSPDGTIRPIEWYPVERPDPAGSLNATARDLAQWLRFQLGEGTFEGKRLVSAANLAETHLPQTPIPLEGQAKAMNPDTTRMSYGMAWVIQDYRGHQLVSHAGAIDGFRSHITLVPEAKLGVALLNNLDRTWMNLAASNNLVDLFLGLPKKDWNDYVAAQVKEQEKNVQAKYKELFAKRRLGTVPSRVLKAYTGTYEDPAYGTAKVSLEGGTLVWQWGHFTSRLEHFQFDTFLLQNELMGYPQVVFTLGAGGEVEAMKVAEPLEAEFKKVKAK